MRTGPLIRKRKKEKQYQRFIAQKQGGCDFCAFDKTKEQVRREFKHFWVVVNLFGYDMWDQLNVLDHLLVVPKRHVDSISQFSEAESKEYMKILSAYEQNSYSVYSRAPQNVSKSVTHQHTHLIRLGDKKKKAVFFIRKPHVVVYV